MQQSSPPSKSWTTTVEIDEQGEYVLVLPPELTESLGWQIGDTLSFEIKDEQVIITKVL